MSSRGERRAEADRIATAPARWPRNAPIAAEAGGLIDPSEATDWLRLLALECPECGGEIPWSSA